MEDMNGKQRWTEEKKIYIYIFSSVVCICVCNNEGIMYTHAYTNGMYDH